MAVIYSPGDTVWLLVYLVVFPLIAEIMVIPVMTMASAPLNVAPSEAAKPEQGLAKWKLNPTPFYQGIRLPG